MTSDEQTIIHFFNAQIFKTEQLYYMESIGFNSKCTVYRTINHLYAKVFFKLLEEFKLDYYVFAGTAIGYMRNQQNIPWVDDYDILIFEDEIQHFETVIIHKLVEYGFTCFKPPNAGGYHVLSSYGQLLFQCDVFYTRVDKDNTIKNLDGWGMYTSKKIPLKMVKPKKYLMIDDDLTLPFFNEIQNDIIQEYGDVIQQCVIQLEHKYRHTIQKPFHLVYDVFHMLKQRAIDRTRYQIYSSELSHPEIISTIQPTTHFTLTEEKYKVSSFQINLFMNYEEVMTQHFNFLKYIYRNRADVLCILSPVFLLYCPDIKLYFKNMKIHFYMTERLENKDLIFLNYVDTVYCSKAEYMEELHNSIWLIHHPVIDSIRVITFGTFDLFHQGHINLLTRARHYGSLTVGVSTDDLNAKKNKTAIRSLQQRKADVSSYSENVFDEESLELKNQYVQKYNCNLLIMGDDWKDRFDFCSCACIYLPRTPDI